MAPVPEFVVSGVLVATGGVLALAGRHVYETAIKVLGFLVGFGAVAVGGAAAQFVGGEASGGLFSPTVLVAGVVTGIVTMSIAWLAYVLAVVAPGAVGGGVVGMSVVGPPAGGEWAVVLLLAAAGGAVAWYLHQVLLVVVTAVIGGFLVALGVETGALTSLPFVRRPELLVRDPQFAVDAAVQFAQSLLAVTAVVAVVGVAVQVGLTPGGEADAE